MHAYNTRSKLKVRIHTKQSMLRTPPSGNQPNIEETLEQSTSRQGTSETAGLGTFNTPLTALRRDACLQTNNSSPIIDVSTQTISSNRAVATNTVDENTSYRGNLDFGDSSSEISEVDMAEPTLNTAYDDNEEIIHPKVQEPRKFKPGSSGNAVEFLREFEEAAESHRWDTKAKIKYFKLYLGGRAAVWYRGYAARNGDATWNALITEFKNEFFPVGYSRMMQDEWRNRVQAEDEDPRAYFYAMLDIHDTLEDKLTDEQIKNNIEAGLLPELQEKVAIREPETLSELKQVIDKICDTENRIKVARERKQSSASEAVNADELNKRIKDLENKLSRMSAQQNSPRYTAR